MSHVKDILIRTMHAIYYLPLLNDDLFIFVHCLSGSFDSYSHMLTFPDDMQFALFPYLK